MTRASGFITVARMLSATGRVTRRKAATWNIVGFSRSGIKRSPTGSVIASRLPTGVTGIETNDVNTTHGGDADE
jgi:hypothetical protein